MKKKSKKENEWYVLKCYYGKKIYLCDSFLLERDK